MLEIRVAHPSEHDAVGELLASVFVGEGWSDDGYAATLRDVSGRAAQTEVLVALQDGRVVGTVTLVLHGGEYGERAEPEAAVIRMLATAPEARGRGVGAALVTECLTRARSAGRTVVRLSTQPRMADAQRLYERLGFTRTPERDWDVRPDFRLMTYARPLRYCGLCGEPGRHEECERRLGLEPPRYCSACRRRMVVQVHPTGWSARCVEHGTFTG